MKNKKIILSAAGAAFAASLLLGGTGAFFADTETSSGNTFTAGGIDLQIDNESYVTSTTTGELVFSPATSWQFADLGGRLFFDFADLKPGDAGEDTISLHVRDNPAWVCMNLRITATPENGQSGPEARIDQTAGENEGELQQELEFIFWADDGDNVLEQGEKVVKRGTAQDVFDGESFALADSRNRDLWNQGGPLGGDEGALYHVGKAWCFGDLSETPLPNNASTSPLERGTGTGCDGSRASNLTQTDGLVADVSFFAVQSRNNLDYVCAGERPRITLIEGTNDSPLERNYSIAPTGLKWFAKLKNVNNNYERIIGLPVSPFIEGGDWSKFSYGDSVWVPGETGSFTLSYDGQGTASLAVEGYNTLTYRVGAETYSRLAVTLKAPPGVTTEVHDLSFDRGELSITSLDVSNLTKHLIIQGVDLSTGFILSGKFSFSSLPAAGNQDNPRIGFFVD